MPSRYCANMTCRLCGAVEETQEHIINCPAVKGEKPNIEMAVVYDMTSADPSDINVICSRLRIFSDLIAQLS